MSSKVWEVMLHAAGAVSPCCLPNCSTRHVTETARGVIASAAKDVGNLSRELECVDGVYWQVRATKRA